MSRQRIILLGLVLVVFVGCGRSVSRVVGKSGREILMVEGMLDARHMIGPVSKYKTDGCYTGKGECVTIKDVTFMMSDGKHFVTVEYKEGTVFEGRIVWNPHGEGESLIQSRGISRIFGNAIELELPKDFAIMKGVSVVNNGNGDKVKTLTYVSTDGKIYDKEYRQGIVARNMSGWIEIVPKSVK